MVSYWQGGAMHCSNAAQACCLVTGCGVIRQSNGYLLLAVLMLLCSIIIRCIQSALNFLTDSFPTSGFEFPCLFNFCTSFFSLYSQACQSAVLIYMPSNRRQLIACATYIIANISRPTRMSKPVHLENYFANLNLTVFLILFTM